MSVTGTAEGMDDPLLGAPSGGRDQMSKGRKILDGISARRAPGPFASNRGGETTLELRQWQNMVDLQARLAAYLRSVGQPSDED